MNPIELVRRGTDDVIALACGACGTVQGLSNPLLGRHLAEQCCTLATCACGATCERYRTTCAACVAREDETREAAAIAKATRVSLADYLAETGADAMVCTERLGGGEHYTHPDDCDEPWAWACTRMAWPILDAVSIAEGLCEEAEAYEGAIERLDTDSLQTVLDAWQATQADGPGWMVDPSRIVLLSEAAS